MRFNQHLVRVFKIPPPSGQFCFGGGNEIAFIEVDWFTDEHGLLASEDGRSQVEEFIRSKRYYSPNEPYLILSPLASFTLNYTASR